MSDTPVIVCHELQKTYHEGDLRVDVLRGVDLTLMPGECLAIVGASGSGKSTLLHLLGGLDLPTAGSVRIADQELAGLDERRRGLLRNRTLGFVYQFHHLLAEFTALENVAMPLLIRKQSSATATEEAERLLERIGLAHRMAHKPGEMSGGERQRAAIARALVTRPRCILADEPTGNLDEQTASQVFEVMMALNREMGASLIMVTHNLALAARFDRVMRLHDGMLTPA